MSEPTGRDWRLLQFLKEHEGSGKTDAEIMQAFEAREIALRTYFIQPWLTVPRLRINHRFRRMR